MWSWLKDPRELNAPLIRADHALLRAPYKRTIVGALRQRDKKRSGLCDAWPERADEHASYCTRSQHPDRLHSNSRASPMNPATIKKFHRDSSQRWWPRRNAKPGTNGCG
jgi:hypothetical protein